MRTIVVVDYNPQWKVEFEKLKAIYMKKLGDLPVDIQHVGSTAVPGLAAKPIIDIDIIVPNVETLEVVISRLAELGYEHQGDMGIKGREAFKRVDESVPHCEYTDSWMEHHLYALIEGCVSLENHLRLREYLRDHEEDVRAYGELKKKLAKKYPHDIDSYIEEKTWLITEILSKAGISTDELDDITEQNKK